MMMPTKEDFDNLSPADFMDLAEAEHRLAKAQRGVGDWEAMRRAANRRYVWCIVLALVAAAIILTLLAVGAMPAGAQVPMHQACATHEVILKALEGRYKERVFANATMGRNLVEFTRSPSRSWSVVITDPQSNLSCLVASGEDLEAVKMEPPGRDG